MRRVIILAALALTIFSFTYGCGNSGTDTTSGSPDATGAGTIDHSGGNNAASTTNTDTGNTSSFGTDTTSTNQNNRNNTSTNNNRRDSL